MQLRSWLTLLIVLAAVTLSVVLQLVAPSETSAAIGEVAAGPAANTAAFGPDGQTGVWPELVTLLFLTVANVVVLGRRRPRARPAEEQRPTPWQRLVASRY